MFVINYAVIKKNDIANGVGVRVSLFVSGCRHKCKNCFNSEAWDFNYGKKFTEETISEITEALDHDYVRGLSLLGGEPFEPENQEDILKLLSVVSDKFPDKDIWCYTGFGFDTDLAAGKVGNPDTVKKILSLLDVIVDGKYIEKLKDASLLFRGSANQRIIDVKKSLAENKVILLPGKWERKMGSGSIEDA